MQTRATWFGLAAEVTRIDSKLPNVLRQSRTQPGEAPNPKCASTRQGERGEDESQGHGCSTPGKPLPNQEPRDRQKDARYLKHKHDVAGRSPSSPYDVFKGAQRLGRRRKKPETGVCPVKTDCGL